MRSWIDRDPKAAGMLLLVAVALGLGLIIELVFAKPLGASCKSDVDCASHRCLQSVAFEWSSVGGTCVKECTTDADCPVHFACDPVDLVATEPYSRVPADAPRQLGHFCQKR